jgi:hypothetical protein
MVGKTKVDGNDSYEGLACVEDEKRERITRRTL